MTTGDEAWPVSASSEASAAVASRVGLGPWWERDRFDVPYPDLGRSLRASGPVVVVAGDRLLAIVRGGRRRLTVVRPDGRLSRLPTAEVRDLVAAQVESPALAALGHVPTTARQPLLEVQLAMTRVEVGWFVRPRADAPFRVLARNLHLSRRVAAVFTSHLAVYSSFLAAWAVLGGAAVGGTLDGRAVGAGAMLLVAMVAARVVASWSAGSLTVEAGSLLKRRLLGGVLEREPDEVRDKGVGQVLGIVLEAEALETLALSGGYAVFLALAELAAAAVALAAGLRPAVTLGLLVLWCALAAGTALAYLRRRRPWAAARLGLTHTFVERVVGHRTRLAQEGRSIRDLADDDDLAEYERLATRMDRWGVALLAALPRGWLVLALAALLLPIPNAARPLALVTALGGVVLAFHAMEKLASGLLQLADAAAAARGVDASGEQAVPAGSRSMRVDQAAPAPAARSEGRGAAGGPATEHPLVRLDSVRFAFGRRSVLRDVSLAVARGERVLVDGPSGAGKSTLGALLGGTRTPTDGSVDGACRVTTVPQFHENHVLSGSLAFNLLLGRNWPPTREDLSDAIEVSVELGLGPLLARMPAGVEQPVGEVGWQLSHGERSRVFIARALLSGSEVVVLDESLAALDPTSVRQTLECATRRAQALVVISHE